MLTKKQVRKIESEAGKVRDYDLYKALHRVGDDCTKSEIESALKQILEPGVFARVVAVFNLMTED